jgi:hypothetical protein
MQLRATQYNATQCSAVQRITMQRCAAQHNAEPKLNEVPKQTAAEGWLKVN